MLLYFLENTSIYMVADLHNTDTAEGYSGKLIVQNKGFLIVLAVCIFPGLLGKANKSAKF